MLQTQCLRIGGDKSNYVLFLKHIQSIEMKIVKSKGMEALEGKYKKLMDPI